MNTILIVDDEQDILDLLDFTLSSIGYDAICCIDTSNVKDILDQEDISLMIMDRNLPGVEGSIFIKSLRDEGYNIPTIFLSAKDSDDDILEGFDRGGDDYITKPFNLNLLKARVNALIKRTKNEDKNIKIRDIVYNSSSKKFYIDKKEISLTHREHDLLLEFIKNKNILLDRDTLAQNVWGDLSEIQPKTVNVAIKRLKEKIDPKGDKNYIKSIRGQGYIFE